MQQEIIAEIAKHLGVTAQDIDIHASLTEDLALGPIDKADLLYALSNAFNVQFSQSDAEGLKTVSDIIVAIEDASLE